MLGWRWVATTETQEIAESWERFICGMSTPSLDIDVANVRPSCTKLIVFAYLEWNREMRTNFVRWLFYSGFKKKAPRAISEIKKFAQKTMGTADVRIDSQLNKYVWSKGVRNIPYRVRVRMSRRRNEDEEAKEKVRSVQQQVKMWIMVFANSRLVV